MKNKSMAQYSITVSSELTADEVLNDFDPHLMDEISLVMSNLTGKKLNLL